MVKNYFVFSIGPLWGYLVAKLRNKKENAKRKIDFLFIFGLFCGFFVCFPCVFTNKKTFMDSQVGKTGDKKRSFVTCFFCFSICFMDALKEKTIMMHSKNFHLQAERVHDW